MKINLKNTRFLNFDLSILSEKDFLNQIDHIKGLVKNFDRILINCKSPFHFASSFFALASLGKEIIILPNNLDGTLDSFRNEYDFVLTEQENIVFKDQNQSEIQLDLSSLISIYTSGSQGTPVKIVKKLEYYLKECEVLEKTFHKNFAEDSMVFSTVSFQHIYGLIFRIIWPLLNSRTIANFDILYPEELKKVCQHQNNNILVSSPAFLKRLQVSEFENFSLQKIKNVFSSGGALSYEASKVTKHSFGVWPIEVYGSTETGGIAYRNQDNHNQLWICFDEVLLSNNEQGCLKVESAFIPEENFQTNDLVEFSDDQRFLLKGRKDRIKKIEEKRLSLIDLENRIKQMTTIKDAYCLVLEQDNRQIVSCIVAETKEWECVSKKDKVMALKKHLLKWFEPVLHPKKIRFLDHLPYNEQSKLPLEKVKRLFDANG